MKISFVYPKTGMDKSGVSVGFPLSIMCASSKLVEKGYDVELLDSRLGEVNPTGDVICFSVMTGYQIKDALKIAKKVRKKNEDSFFVWGGAHPSKLPGQTLMNNLVDLVVVGEGEQVIVDLVQDIECNVNVLMKGVYRANIIKDLNDLPELPYHLINVNDYFMNLYNSKKTLSFLSGRGCPRRCKFCTINQIKWRQKSPERMLKEIKQLISFGAESISVVDSNFFVNVNAVEELLELLEENSIHVNFLVTARADDVSKFSDKFLQRLVCNGFKELFVGVESGSQVVLDNIKKDITLLQIQDCNIKLRDVGITPIYSFMCGFPIENIEEVFDTIDVMLQLKQANPNCSLTGLKLFTPYPGTSLAKECEAQGFKFPEVLEDWGDYNYNTGTFSKNKLLEKLSYVTYFLDLNNMLNFAKNPLLILMVKAYHKIVWFRCKHKFFWFMPEWRLIKWVVNR